MDKTSVGEATIHLLARYGVDTIFGIPGVHTLEFYRGLAEGSPIKHVQARNELGAGFMADGYARASGKPGVCLTISGPGVTNVTTALGQAYADSLPLLLISAEAPSNTLGKGWGVLHEVTDLNAVTRPLTAFSKLVTDPQDIPKLLARAFNLFASGRPRPVHIAIPTDILEMPVEDQWSASIQGEKPKPDALLIKEIAELLQTKTNPVILVGGGAVGADIKSLAERTGAIVIASNAGKGIIPDSHPLSLGGSICRPETQAVLKDADLVLAIGTELSETDSWVAKLDFTCPLIRVDIDPSQMANHYEAEHEIVGDAAFSVGKILEHLDDVTPDLSEMEKRVSAIRQQISGNLAGSEPKHRIIHEVLREILPDETFIMADATQLTYSGSFMMPVELPRRWQYAAGYCALGFAFPNAIGAKLAMPDAPVTAIAGDGGTMFTVQELVTAAEQKLSIPLILWHNNGYKQIRDDMRDGNIPRVAVDGWSPDYPALAKAMHCHSVEPESLETFKQAVTSALNSDRPTLVIVHEDSGWLNSAG